MIQVLPQIQDHYLNYYQTFAFLNKVVWLSYYHNYHGENQQENLFIQQLLDYYLHDYLK